MNYKANSILKTFLRSNRIKLGLSIQAVAELTEVNPFTIEMWEEFPVKAPLYQIANLVELYEANRFDFQMCMLEAQRALRSDFNRPPLHPH